LIQKIRKNIINHLLLQNDWMQSKLINYKNKIITIVISDIKIIFQVQDNGQLETIDESKKTDCIINLTINDFINQFVNNKNKNKKIIVGGDLELANEVSQILKKINWDIEEDLSKYIGDIPAIHTTKLIKKIFKVNKNNINNLTSSLIEYWEEENPLLAKKRNVSYFNSEVDKIVEDTEILEARIQIINKRKL